MLKPNQFEAIPNLNPWEVSNAFLEPILGREYHVHSGARIYPLFPEPSPNPSTKNRSTGQTMNETN